MHDPHRQADRTGVVGIEAIEQEIAPLDQHDQQRAAGHESGFDQVPRGHAQHIAEPVSYTHLTLPTTSPV